MRKSIGISRKFGPQHLTRVEKNHGVQTAVMRAVAHGIAQDTDAVSRFEGFSRPPKTLQDGRAAGDDIPFNGFAAAIGLKYQREGRMRIAPVEGLDRAF